MLAKRDWITLGLIGLAQVGLVLCYWGLQPQYYQPKLNSAYVVKPGESRPVAAPAPKVSETETVANWQSDQSAEPPLVTEATAELIPAHFEKPLTPLFQDAKLEPTPSNGLSLGSPAPMDTVPPIPAPALPPSEPLPSPPEIVPPMFSQATPVKPEVPPVKPVVPPAKPEVPPPPATAPLPGPETVPPLPPAGPPGPVVPPSGVAPPGISEAPPPPSAPVPPPPGSPFANLQSHPKFGTAPGHHFSTAKPAEAKAGAPIVTVSVAKKYGPPPKAEGPSPWKFQVAVIEQRTVLMARTETGASFLIRCDSLNLSRPGGVVEATGKVEIEGKALKGGCDRLVINWSEDRLQLSGDAHVTRWTNGDKLEMRGPQLQLHLSKLPPEVPVQNAVEVFRY